MSTLKTIILSLILVCVFLVPSCCVHRDNQWHESGTGLLMGCVQETFIIFGAEMKHFTFNENLTEMI